MRILEQDLRAAAKLCIRAAATVDLDAPFGGGQSSRRRHHLRKERFKQAAARVRCGKTEVEELGLSNSDLAWAAANARLLDQVELAQCLEEAERRLTDVLDLRALRMLDGRTYAIVHDHRSPGAFVVRLVGRGAPGLDHKVVGESRDVLGYGPYLHRAVEHALAGYGVPTS